MNGRAVGGIRHQHMEVIAIDQATRVEILLHGEPCAEQPDGTHIGPRDCLCGRVSNMYKGNSDGLLNCGRNPVHGIGTHDQQLCACQLKLLGRLPQDRSLGDTFVMTTLSIITLLIALMGPSMIGLAAGAGSMGYLQSVMTVGLLRQAGRAVGSASARSPERVTHRNDASGGMGGTGDQSVQGSTHCMSQVQADSYAGMASRIGHRLKMVE